jgi:hypothetical protein
MADRNPAGECLRGGHLPTEIVSVAMESTGVYWKPVRNIRTVAGRTGGLRRNALNYRSCVRFKGARSHAVANQLNSSARDTRTLGEEPHTWLGAVIIRAPSSREVKPESGGLILTEFPYLLRARSEMPTHLGCRELRPATQPQGILGPSGRPTRFA